jgi:hypothetical protein
MTSSPVSSPENLSFLHSCRVINAEAGTPSSATTVIGAPFAERFCVAHGVASDRYVDAMLRRCLYPHARWLAWILPHSIFAADRELISSLGHLRRVSQFRDELRDHREHPENRGWLRRCLRLRVSVGAARRVFIATLTGR